MPARDEQGFIWIPRDNTTNWKLTVDGVDVSYEWNKAEFKRGLYTVGSCKIEIQNYDGSYTDRFEPGDDIELYLDFNDASNLVWKGSVEAPKSNVDRGTIEIKGRYLSDIMLDITVTESFEDVEVSEILKTLIDTYTDDFTYNNVETTDSVVTVAWSNKPLWSCIKDLSRLSNSRYYVDVNKDIHFFAAGSESNDDEAVVWNDNMLDISGLGDDTVTVKNKIIVYGETDAGLPIVYTAVDEDSDYPVKETVVKDQDISTYEQARNRGDAILEQKKNPEARGKTKSYLLPTIKPGQMMWISSPFEGIHDQYQVNSIKHYLGRETTALEVSDVQAIPKIFRESREKEMALEKITNPNRLDDSYIFPLNDNTNVQSLTGDFNVDGDGNFPNNYLELSSGTSGTMVSNPKNTPSEVTEAQLKIDGDNLKNSSFYISADNGITWQEFSREEYQTINATGNKLKLKIELSGSDARVGNAVILYK